MSKSEGPAADFAGVARGVRWSALSAFVLRLSQFSMGVITARIVAPEQFGTYAVALTVFTIVITISDAGVAQAVVRDVMRTAQIGPSAMTITFSATLLTAVAMAAGASPLATVLGASAADGPIRILALTLVASSFGTIPAMVLARDYRQRERFYSDAANFVVSSALLILLALDGWGAMALACSRLAGQIVSAVVLNSLVGERYGFGFDRQEVASLLRFSAPLALANCLLVAVSNVDTIAVARIAGATQLGFYNLAFTVAAWPVSIFSSILMNITVTTLARVQHDVTALRAHLAAAMSSLAGAAFPVSALLMALAGPVIVDVYGTRWSPAAPILVTLGLFASVRVVQVLLTDLLIATGHTPVLLRLQFIWLIALIPMMIVCTMRWGIIGAGIAHVVVGVFLILPLYLSAVRQRTGIGLGWLFASTGRPALGAVAAGLTAWFVGSSTEGSWVQLLAGGLAGLTVYIGVT